MFPGERREERGMDRLAVGIAERECEEGAFLERRMGERRVGERRQGERRRAIVNYSFLLSGLGCRRTGKDRRVGERRKADRRSSQGASSPRMAN